MKIYDFDGKKNICGLRIKLARKRLKMTQEDLAARLQTNGILIDRISLSRIESGTRFVSDFELKYFSKILECSVLWLLTGNEEAGSC